MVRQLAPSRQRSVRASERSALADGGRRRAYLKRARDDGAIALDDDELILTLSLRPERREPDRAPCHQPTRRRAPQDSEHTRRVARGFVDRPHFDVSPTRGNICWWRCAPLESRQGSGADQAASKEPIEIAVNRPRGAHDVFERPRRARRVWSGRPAHPIGYRINPPQRGGKKAGLLRPPPR